MRKKLVPERPIEITLHVFTLPFLSVSPTKFTRQAICIELPLKTAGDSQEKAFLNMRTLIRTYLNFPFEALTHCVTTLSSVYHPQSQEYFNKVFGDGHDWFVQNHIERFFMDYKSRIYHLQELCVFDKDATDTLKA